MTLLSLKTGALIRGAPVQQKEKIMASAKYVCIKGCSVSGKRLKVGQPVAVSKDVTDTKLQRLVRMGRVAEEGDERVKEAIARAKEEKDRLSGKSKDPSVVPQPAKASMPSAVATKTK